MEVGGTRSGLPDLREGDHHGVVNDWGEVVTRVLGVFGSAGNVFTATMLIRDY